jgi:hypothetical protein
MIRLYSNMPFTRQKGHSRMVITGTMSARHLLKVVPVVEVVRVVSLTHCLQLDYELIGYIGVALCQDSSCETPSRYASLKHVCVCSCKYRVM